MRGVYYLCAVKTKINTPLMYEVLDKDTIKSENLPYLSVAKRGYAPKGYLAKVIQCILYMPENWLQMADYFCLCMMQAPLAMSSMPCNRPRWWVYAYVLIIK